MPGNTHEWFQIGQLPKPGGGSRGDQKRLIWLLQTSRQVLNSTVKLRPSPFPGGLRNEMQRAWPEAEKSLRLATKTLRKDKDLNVLKPRLQKAGLTGSSLEFKAKSTEYHARNYSKHLGQILTYPGRPTWSERLAKFVGPVFKCMNSVMDSLSDVLPGIEIAKEFKDHVEASLDALEQKEE